MPDEIERLVSGSVKLISDKICEVKNLKQNIRKLSCSAVKTIMERSVMPDLSIQSNDPWVKKS